MRFNNEKITNKIEKTPENFLIVEGRFLKGNKKMRYYRDNSVTIEQIPSENINDDLAKSFLHKTVTSRHPIDDSGKYVFVDSFNAKQFKIGTIIDSFVETEGNDKYLSGKLQIENEECIQRIMNAVENGNAVDISASYGSIPINVVDNLYNQTNIIPNHVAILFDEAGRAGPDVQLIFNHSDCGIEKNNLGGNMKVKYKGKEYDENEIVEMLVTKDNTINTITNDLTNMTNSFNSVTADLNTEKEAHVITTNKLTNLENKMTGIEQSFNTMKAANEVVTYKNEASQFTDVDMSKMNSVEIMTEVIKLAQPTFNSTETDTVESLTPIYTFAKSILSGQNTGIPGGTKGKTDVTQNFNSEDGEAALNDASNQLDAYFAKGGKE